MSLAIRIYWLLCLHLHIYVFVERPHADHSKKFEKHAEKAGEEAKKAVDELKKDDKVYKKKLQEGENYVVERVREFASFASTQVANTMNYACGVAHSTAARAQSLACRAASEVQNPVILVNLLLGSGVVAALLTGYAKYDTRYLKDKSDGAILCVVGSATALLALDTVLSAKYYSKFDKK